MSLDFFLQKLVPKDKKFFPLFDKSVGNLLLTAKVLLDAVNADNMEERNKFIKEIENLEHAGDDITHLIFSELSSNFITPFDREDIQELATALDDILDFIHGSSKRIQLYKIEKISPDIIKLAELIYKCIEQLNSAVKELKNMKNIGRIKEACVKINSIENHADDIFNNALARLFEEQKDAIYLIKIKEIYSALETATDKCEDAANVLESIVVKAT